MLYKPNWMVTIEAIKSLTIQVDSLIVVDNSPREDNSSILKEFSNVKYISLGDNKGIEAAQNIGIKWLIEKIYIYYFLRSGFYSI